MTLPRGVGLRRWIESRRLSARGVEQGSQALEADGTEPVPPGRTAEFRPPFPANGMGLGSPAVSATTAAPFPWETALEPTPTSLSHPQVKERSPDA
jgi:hypothetical protein